MSMQTSNSKTQGEKYNMAKRRKTLAGVNFDLREIEPLTRNQLKAFESSKNLVLHGLAGTGKTLLALASALEQKNKYCQAFTRNYSSFR